MGKSETLIAVGILIIFLVVVIPRLVSLQFSFSGGSVGIRQQMIEEVAADVARDVTGTPSNESNR